MTEWTRFKPADGYHIWPDNVSHVTHLASGLSVFSEGRIRAGLVYDESKLNRERIQVVWVSPNDWVGGFLYGSIKFDFDWKKLVSGRRTYWVEAITKYKPPAARILVTEVNRDADPSLQAYDPTVPGGPWWYDASSDQHYWNDAFTLEIMLEQDLLVSESTRISFVPHHRTWCAVDNTNCPDDFERNHGLIGGRFLAGVLGRRLTIRAETRME
jgi:hypothetical protein